MYQVLLLTNIFQLTTSRRGRRLTPDWCGIGDLIFQLTTSRRGRLNRSNQYDDIQVFQLTTSRRGRQYKVGRLLQALEYFNSRPHEEVDAEHSEASREGTHFNSRPHEEVDITAGVNLIFQLAFQLTTSRRGRHGNYEHTCADFTFQLTTSRRGRRRSATCWRYGIVISTHDLTKRSTQELFLAFARIQDFNSRPHEEVDLACAFVARRKNISTHDLTKRSTFLIFRIQTFTIISTHDLTKRSTLLQVLLQTCHSHFNSRPHEEVDICNTST